MIGLGPARRLILSGETIGAEEALRLGLIDHLVPTERFEAGVAEVLAPYLNALRTASMTSKHLMRRVLDAPFETVYRHLCHCWPNAWLYPMSEGPRKLGAAALSAVASAFCHYALLRSGNAPAPADPIRLAQIALEHFPARVTRQRTNEIHRAGQLKATQLPPAETDDLLLCGRRSRA